MTAMKEATGIDLKDLIEANGKEAKITKNVNITGLEPGEAKDVVASVVAEAITEDEPTASAPILEEWK